MQEKIDRKGANIDWIKLAEYAQYISEFDNLRMELGQNLESQENLETMLDFMATNSGTDI